MTLHDDNKGLQHYIEEVAQMETGMDTAEMWQPAITRNFHGMPDPEGYGSLKVMVRPVNHSRLTPHMQKEREECGCDWKSVQHYECKESGEIICEHEILTD